VSPASRRQAAPDATGGEPPAAGDVFGFGDLGILVESADASHLAWLREFLTPHFELRPGGGHDCRVTVIEESERYGAVFALGPAGGTLDAFALDTRLVSLPRWTPAGVETRLLDTAFEVFYEIAEGGRSITVLSAAGNPKIRTALMRAVRELATNRAQRRGGLLLHASAFAVGDRGVLIGGPKLAGKTTLLVHALRVASARYVSNDRVMVLPQTAPATARGVPTIVALRSGMLALFPELADRVDRASYHHRQSLGEPAPVSPGAGAPLPTNANMSPAQLCRLLDVQPLAQCEVAALVFPRITHEAGGLSVRRIPEAEAATRLTGALFGVPSSRWCSDVFALAGDPAPPDLPALLDRGRALAARVPAFECRLGESAYESRSTAELLVESVLGRALP
jgi:hypothetical protein